MWCQVELTFTSALTADCEVHRWATAGLRPTTRKHSRNVGSVRLTPACLLAGKFVPDEAVLEMKANFSLPSNADEFVDEIVWIEYNRELATPLITQ